MLVRDSIFTPQISPSFRNRSENIRLRSIQYKYNYGDNRFALDESSRARERERERGRALLRLWAYHLSSDVDRRENSWDNRRRSKQSRPAVYRPSPEFSLAIVSARLFRNSRKQGCVIQFPAISTVYAEPFVYVSLYPTVTSVIRIQFDI